MKVNFIFIYNFWKRLRCDELTQCDYDIQYVSSDLITNSVTGFPNDNTCADILPCREYEDNIRPQMPQKMFSRGTCVRKGEIILKANFQI